VALITLLGRRARLAAVGSVAPTTGRSGRQLTTFSIVNPTGSSISTPYARIGHPFKRGDVPSGTAPQFLARGTPQPYSWGAQAYWSDGSLKFAAFLIRFTSSLAGSATRSIEVWNGGAAPSAGARTTTEVYAQNVIVAGTGASPSGANLKGTWKGFLTNDANNYQQLTYLDGDAGNRFKISTHAATSSGGTPHGQLEVEHYIEALTDGSGNLGGFFYMPAFTQPWYNAYDLDHTRPRPNYRGFDPRTLPNWTVNGGSANNLSFPYTAETFMVLGGNASIILANTYWTGSPPKGGQGKAVIPGYVTTTGSLPPGLDTSSIYFLGAVQGSTAISFGRNTDGSGIVGLSTGGSGTHTFHPIPLVNHFHSLRFANSDAQWNYFQGKGSIGADPHVRVQFNQTYWQSTQVIPPYDLTATVADTSFSNNWTPYSLGDLWQDLAAGADRGDLAIIPASCVQHFYNQSAVSEKLARCIGQAGALQGYIFRDYATGNWANLSNTTYKGMSAASASSILWGDVFVGSNCHGFTAPPNNLTSLVVSGMANDHNPNWEYYAYLITGEPQYLEGIIAHANGSIVHLAQGFRNPTFPVTRYGVVVGRNENQNRATAWGNRFIQCTGVMPDKMPDGSQLPTYFSALRATQTFWAKNSMDVTQNYWGPATSFFTTKGIWTSADQAKAGHPTSFMRTGQAWQITGYMAASQAFAYSLNEDSDAKTWLQTQSTYLNWLLSTFGGWHIYNYYNFICPASQGGPGITSNAQFGIIMGRNMVDTISWGSGQFTVTGVNTTNVGWIPTNGDKILFDNDDAFPITSITPSGGNITIVTGENAGSFGSGSVITITGCSVSAYNGTYTLNGGNPWGTSFTAPSTSHGTVSSNCGTITADPSFSPIPLEFAYYTPYYIVGVSGSGTGPHTFGLSATVGGSAITPSSSGSIGGFTTFMTSSSPPAASTGKTGDGGGVGGDSNTILSEVHGMVNWMIATGTTGLSSVQTDASTRLSVGWGSPPNPLVYWWNFADHWG
jgi:hypothetical protein